MATEMPGEADPIDFQMPPGLMSGEATPASSAPVTPRASALVVTAHGFSAQQTDYLESRGNGTSVFYKDATPRVEHFLRSTVAVEGGGNALPVPIKLVMAYEDGTEVSLQDATCLKILGDGRKRLTIPAGGSITFDYRYELGSFRRADRKFSVKIVSDVPGFAPALTPGVLVLSKKKLADDHPRAAAEAARKRARSPSRASDDGDDGWRPAEKRALLEQQAALVDRVANLEAHLARLVEALAPAPTVTPYLSAPPVLITRVPSPGLPDADPDADHALPALPTSGIPSHLELANAVSRREAPLF